jgi:hypothetical protein
LTGVLFHQFLQRLGATPQHRDASALRQQLACNRLANALARARHQRMLIVQIACH